MSKLDLNFAVSLKEKLDCSLSVSGIKGSSFKLIKGNTK